MQYWGPIISVAHKKASKKGLEMLYRGPIITHAWFQLPKANKPRKASNAVSRAYYHAQRTRKKQAKNAWKCRTDGLLSRAHYSNLQKQINQKSIKMPCWGHIITHSLQKRHSWKCCIDGLLSWAVHKKNRQKWLGNAASSAYYFHTDASLHFAKTNKLRKAARNGFHQMEGWQYPYPINQQHYKLFAHTSTLQKFLNFENKDSNFEKKKSS